MVDHSDVLGPPNWKDISSLASLNAKQLLTRYASVHTIQRPFPYWDPAADVELGKLLARLTPNLASHSIDAERCSLSFCFKAELQSCFAPTCQRIMTAQLLICCVITGVTLLSRPP